MKKTMMFTLLILLCGFLTNTAGASKVKPVLDLSTRNFKTDVTAPDEDGSLNKKEIMAAGGIKILHSFAGGAGDGAYPTESLIHSGATIYGMTNGGGVEGQGTIFDSAAKPRKFSWCD